MNEVTKEIVKATFQNYFFDHNENVFLDDARDAGFVVTGQVFGFGVLQIALMDNEWRFYTNLPNGIWDTFEKICKDLGGIEPRQFAEEITIKTLRCE